MTQLYPEIEPYKTEFFKVSDIHTLYLEQSGNPQGKPVIFLHGGPGGQSKPKHRRFFDPQKYRIILFDQRGCGKSTPQGELIENTTSDLVTDMEKIREHLGVEKWLVFGGSWGSTLALAYAEKYTDRVSEMILRGVFTFRKSEIEWLFNGGAKALYPELWEQYIGLLTTQERSNPLEAYTKRILSKDETISAEASMKAAMWEGETSALISDHSINYDVNNDAIIKSYKILFHYISNSGFLKDNQLLDEVEKIQMIPGVIVQGRHDLICPMITAWELHKKWPEATFDIVSLAGHRSENTEISDKLVEAANKFADK